MSEPLTLRILTMNVHKGFGFLNRKFILPELREAVHSVAADIVFLQEVLGAHTKHSLTHNNWPDVPQYEFLADSMWSGFAYGKNAAYPEGHHGNALLSKYPIVHHNNLDVSIGKVEKRGLLHCQLHVPPLDRHIHVICVHLGLREHHRLSQLNLLCALIDTLPDDAPLLVAGDFNDWRLRAQERLLACAGLQEIYTNAYGKPQRSFPALFPLLRLDRIYARNVLSLRPILLSNRPWAHLSDHTPLAAEITI